MKLIQWRTLNYLDHHPSDNSNLVTGLEWEDPLHMNRLSISENRRLTVLLTKVAQSVRLRDIVLRPYFQDYELVYSVNLNCTFLLILSLTGVKKLWNYYSSSFCSNPKFSENTCVFR